MLPSMCRWLAYYGKPVRMDKVLYGPQHSLIDQSLHSRLGAETTNGDGFGIGWYTPSGDPAYYKSTEPAWNDRNLREIAGHVESHLFLAHIRASSGTPVQQTNCHPVPLRQVALGAQRARHRLVHRQARPRAWRRSRPLSARRGLGRLRDAVLPRAHARARGRPGRARSSARSDSSRRSATVTASTHPFQGTIATTNGERLWAFRYSSEGHSRSLYFSTKYETLAALYPDDPRLADFDEETRLVVSEPLGDLPGVWNQVPEASWGVVQPGEDEIGTLPAGRWLLRRPRASTLGASLACRVADERGEAFGAVARSGGRSGR